MSLLSYPKFLTSIKIGCLMFFIHSTSKERFDLGLRQRWLYSKKLSMCCMMNYLSPLCHFYEFDFFHMTETLFLSYKKIKAISIWNLPSSVSSSLGFILFELKEWLEASKFEVV